MPGKREAPLTAVVGGGRTVPPRAAAPLRVDRRSGPLGSWEIVRAAPHPSLRPYVTGYLGYAERTAFARRREPPSDIVPLIVNLGPPLRVGGAEHESGFLAGLSDVAGVVDSGGEQAGLQVNFTPIGATRFLGFPLGEITHRLLPLPELLGAASEELRERLHDAPDWAARFRIADALIARRFAAAPRVPPELEWAWARLTATSGAVRVEELAAELGYSRKHLSARFGERLGLPPKTLARILRFHGVVTELRGGGPHRLVELAARYGYADQAHLSRDFRALAGVTPTDYLRRSGAGFGVIDDW